MADAKELQVREKEQVPTTAEQTKPGLVFKPAVDICETDQEITLLADMPGVTADDIGIDLREDTLTISGTVKPWEGADESDLLIEFEVGQYYRQFALSEMIDKAKIEAKHENGVLRLTMPKAEKAKPRRIAVTSG